MCYVMSPEHMIMDYDRLWIGVHVGVYMHGCVCVCAAVRAHTCAMHASVHDCFKAFAASERGAGSGGDEYVRVCASSDHIALTPILSSILPPFFSLTCIFPNSEISACSPRKPANITTDCLAS